MLEKSPVYQTIYSFYDCYLQRREIDSSMMLLSENAICVGTGRHEVSVGRAAFAQLFQAELQEMPDPIGFTMDGYQEYEYAPNCWSCFCWIQMKMVLKGMGPILYHVRVSAGVHLDREGYRIHALHVSEASSHQQDGEFFPIQYVAENGTEINRETKQELMEMISQVMPGGIIGTYLEDGYPLYAVNERFLEMTGYTYEEYLQDMHGSARTGIHPDDRLYVTKAINQAMEEGEQYELEYRIKKQDGTYFWIREIGRKTVTSDGRQAVISIILDISEQVRVHESLKDESMKDPLTGAYNRRGGHERIESAMAVKEGGYLFLMSDLDCFKQVNDIYGHNHGDYVLRFLVEKLRKCFRKTDTICRLGGDEFAIFLPDCPPNQVIEQKLSGIIQDYKHMIEERYPESHSSVSFGGIYGKSKHTFTELYQLADAVLYDVKQKSKGSFQVRVV